jgi:DNA invertase Pin-like site-specific DNA recombinase
VVSERSKLTSSHLRRQAFIYLRQSSQAQLERNVESTHRQYALVERAIELGFTREQAVVIDEDLGISGSGMSERTGFARLAAEVALGHAGLVLGLEVSRLARNNVDWYRLLDLCGVTDTVIGDSDGLYHPGSFNDRLLLGLKGTMSEAELHVLRARLNGGIRNKAARGELRKAAAGRAGVGRGRRRGPARPRRSDPRRDPNDLRPVRGARLGPPGVAVDAPRRRAVPRPPVRLWR